MKLLQKFSFIIFLFLLLISLSTANSFQSKKMKPNNQIIPISKIKTFQDNIKQVSTQK